MAVSGPCALPHGEHGLAAAHPASITVMTSFPWACRFEVTHGAGRLVQRVGLVYDRGELAGHEVPGAPVQPGGVDLHEYLVVCRRSRAGRSLRRATRRQRRRCPARSPASSAAAALAAQFAAVP